MKNKIITLSIVLISLVFTGLISSIFGLVTWLIGYGFWISFLIVLFIQFFGYRFYSIYMDKKIKVLNKNIDNIPQYIELTCAFCKNKSQVKVFLNKETRYVCPHCNNKNLVIMQFYTVRVTEPKIAKIDIPLKDIIPKGMKEEQINKINEEIKIEKEPQPPSK